MKRVLLFNGPPRSGKDTAAQTAAKTANARHLKLAYHVKTGTHAQYKIPPSYRPEAFDPVKDHPHILFEGRTPRECYIDYSEKYCKPSFGTHYFAHLLAQEILRSDHDRFAISDCGFQIEYDYLLAQDLIDIVVVQIIREDCTFDNDSRDYLNVPSTNLITIINNSSIGRFKQAINAIAEDFFNEE